MSDSQFNCTLLRPIESICEPDPRMRSFSMGLADIHGDMAGIGLSDNVPSDIVRQFETVKNLYLYGWFVWQFFTVSEQQAFSCLELALHSRYEKTIPKKKYYPRHKEPGLKALLSYAIDKGDIKNEEFETWRKITYRKARSRYEQIKDQEMLDKGLDRIELNYDEVEIEEEDKDWNYVEVLKGILADRRNEYAHGSSSMHMFHGPLRTIKVVSEIINQIYANEPKQE